jgi:hypothetical protein
MLNKTFRQNEIISGPFFRYGFLTFYVLLGALQFSLELLKPVHDLFSILRGLSLYIMLVLVHLALCFTFGPRLQIIVRVAAILAFVAAIAVIIDDFRRLSGNQPSESTQRIEEALRSP